MRSQGTKETQGINGDAAALQRRLAAAVHHSAGTAGAPCSYVRHRPTDWVTPSSQVICGICHPSAAGVEGIVRRDEPRFDELAAAAQSRVSSVVRTAPPVEAAAVAESDGQVDLWSTAA